jgi:hypothetical protein
MYDLTMYDVQLIVKIGCKITKKIPHMQVFVGFFGLEGMILLFNRLDYFGGIAGYDHIVRDVMSNDRTGSNNHTVSDGDTRTNDYSAAQPAVIAYPYRQTCFYGLTPLHIIMRMVRCQQLTVGPDKRVRADGNTSAIQEDPIKIDKRTFAYADSVTVVAVEWRTNDYRGMRIGNESFDATM